GVEKTTSRITLYEILAEGVDGAGTPSVIESAPIRVSQNLDLIPATLDLAGAETLLINAVGKEMILRDAIARIQARYDWVLLDGPPRLALLRINILAAGDAILVPLQCEFYALEGLSLLLPTVEIVRKRI